MSFLVAIGALLLAAAVIAVLGAVVAWREARRSAEQARALEALNATYQHLRPRVAPAVGQVPYSGQVTYGGQLPYGGQPYEGRPHYFQGGAEWEAQSLAPRRQPARKWAWAAGIVAALDLVGAAALVLSVEKLSFGGGGPKPLQHVASLAPQTRARSGAGALGKAAAHHGGSHGPSRTQRALGTADVHTLAGTGPVVATVTPDLGAPGQVVTLSGSGFFSPDGLISVSFGGVQAPVRCPTRNLCMVTVPAGPGGKSVTVVLKTALGTSNTVTFSYE